jgi:hypothetical protein
MGTIIHSISAKLLIITLVILFFNIPFGYWRASVKKFSWPWILAVHLPIPFIILLRIASGVGWHAVTFLLFIGGFFLGQLSGSTGYSLTHKKASDKNRPP